MTYVEDIYLYNIITQKHKAWTPINLADDNTFFKSKSTRVLLATEGTDLLICSSMHNK
jgi:hypothetical protein